MYRVFGDTVIHLRLAGRAGLWCTRGQRCSGSGWGRQLRSGPRGPGRGKAVPPRPGDPSLVTPASQRELLQESVQWPHLGAAQILKRRYLCTSPLEGCILTAKTFSKLKNDSKEHFSFTEKKAGCLSFS